MNKSLFDQLAEGVASAIRDIREKVVEEGWFGRVVTAEHAPETSSAPGGDPAQGLQGRSLWQEQVRDIPATGEEIARPEPGLDR